MILSRTKTYFFLLGLLVAICLLYQGVWLISSTTEGDILSFGHGSGRYKSVEHIKVSYTVHDQEYQCFYLRSGTSVDSNTIRIRYLLFAPAWSRLDSAMGNWGFVLVSTAVFVSILTVIFLQKEIIPYSAQFVIDKRFPFLRQKNREKA